MIGAEGAEGGWVDGLRRGSTGSSIFSTPRHRPTREGRNWTREALVSPVGSRIRRSGSHPSTPRTPPPTSTSPRGRPARGRGRGGSGGAARGAIAGRKRGASRASGEFGAHPASADVRGCLRVASASHGGARRRLDGARVGEISSGARSRSFRSREGGARGRSGGRDSGARRRSARGEREVRRVDARGGGRGRRRARRCERGERGARATRPGGRSGSIDPRASIRHAIKQQGISSGVD